MEDEVSLVSVVIPVFNGGNVLAGAIENVLAQNYPNLEILVVDDGSEDHTADVAAKYSNAVRYVYQQNAGPSAARNQGIRLARGTLIGFLDADDFWSIDKLKIQTAYLEANPDVEIVQGHIQRFSLNGPGPVDLAQVEPTTEPYRYINIGSALYRKTVFERVGLFDETLRDNEDTDWYIRAWEKGVEKAVLDSVTLYYRQHDSSLTRFQTPVNYGLTKLIKRHLDRLGDGRVEADYRWPLTEYLGKPPTK